MKFFEIEENNQHNYKLLDKVQAYVGACRHEAETLEHQSQTLDCDRVNLEQSCAFLEEEAATWEIIYSLYLERLRPDVDCPKEVNDPELNTSEAAISEIIFSKDKEAREVQIIIDWLEERARYNLDRRHKADEQFAGKYQPWMETIFHLKTNFAGKASKKREETVPFLGLDSVTAFGKKLMGCDMSEEERFLRYLYLLLRGGSLKRAQQLCMQCGDFLRAATFEGARYHDPLSHEGNVNRIRYLATCRKMTENIKLNAYERAIYGLLGGDYSSVLPVCRTWEDVLWIYLKVWMHWRIHLQVLKTTYYGPNKSLSILASLGNAIVAGDTESDTLAGISTWTLRQVVEEVTTVCRRKNIATTMNNSLMQLFRTVQTNVMLNDVEGLLIAVHDILVEAALTNKNVEAPESEDRRLSMYRFTAHAASLIGEIYHMEEMADAAEDHIVPIITYFIDKLIALQQPGQLVALVAHYTASLPGNLQVDYYARFLQDITDPRERIRCLEYCNKEKMDAKRITTAVVSNIHNKTNNANTSSVNASMNDTQQLSPALLPEDCEKIESLGWLFIQSDQYLEALQQANNLCREFLLQQKYQTAQQVMTTLPEDVVEQNRRMLHKVMSEEPASVCTALENTIHEFDCYQSFLKVHHIHASWLAHKSRYNKVTVKSNFLSDLSEELLDTLVDDIICHPSPGWLVDRRLEGGREVGTATVAGEGEQQRASQMKLLRQSLLPEAIFLAISMLKSTPEQENFIYLIVNALMEESNAHNMTFSPQTMHQLLLKVQEIASDQALRAADLSFI